MNSRVENRGLDPSLLQIQGTNQARHASSNDSDDRVVRDWSSEIHLLLVERLLEDGPPGRPVRRSSAVLGGGSAAVHGMLLGT